MASDKWPRPPREPSDPEDPRQLPGGPRPGSQPRSGGQPRPADPRRARDRAGRAPDRPADPRQVEPRFADDLGYRPAPRFTGEPDLTGAPQRWTSSPRGGEQRPDSYPRLAADPRGTGDRRALT